MRTSKSRLLQLTVALAGALTLIVTMATPSSALTSHTMELQDGSMIDTASADPFLLAGAPQCDDNQDNDDDGETDFDGSPVDAECDAEVGGLGRPASQDDSECRNGFQAESAAPTLTFDDNGSGSLSNFTVNFAAAEVCAQVLGSTICFNIQITADATGATGTVSGSAPRHITAGTFDFNIAVSQCAGGFGTPPGFNATNCNVDFENVNFTTNTTGGVAYTEGGGVGNATQIGSIPSGPAFADNSCGSTVIIFVPVDWAEQLNNRLGLPSVVTVTLVGEITPDLSSV